eukprot:scaffold13967_cov35-Prasinocladus_malaysianus.AAC.1
MQELVWITALLPVPFLVIVGRVAFIIKPRALFDGRFRRRGSVWVEIANGRDGSLGESRSN